MSPRPNQRTEVHRKRYKVALDADADRQQREDYMAEIRKRKRKRKKDRKESLQTYQFSTLVKKKKLELLPAKVAGLWSYDNHLQLEATIHFQKLSIENCPLIEEVTEAGVVPRFIQFLERDDFPHLQFEATCALINIASGTPDHTKLVIDNGAIQLFVKLLFSPLDIVCEQAVWALGNVAGYSPKYRDLVLDHKVLRPLLEQLNEHAKLSMWRNVTWTLLTICSVEPQPPSYQVKPVLHALECLIHLNDDEVVANACWALSYLSDGTNDQIQNVIMATGVCNRLVDLLIHSSPSVLIPALRAVGNIVSGDDKRTQSIRCQLLPHMRYLLKSNHCAIKKEACRTISNITAGNEEHIQAVIDANLFTRVIRLLYEAEFDIKKEALWAVSNAISRGTPDQICLLTMEGCIKPLCDLLVCPDSTVVAVCLEGLENILNAGVDDIELCRDNNYYASDIECVGGLETIKYLLSHDNTEICEKAGKILKKYWLEDYNAYKPGLYTSQYIWSPNVTYKWIT